MDLRSLRDFDSLRKIHLGKYLLKKFNPRNALIYFIPRKNVRETRDFIFGNFSVTSQTFKEIDDPTDLRIGHLFCGERNDFVGHIRIVFVSNLPTVSRS